MIRDVSTCTHSRGSAAGHPTPPSPHPSPVRRYPKAPDSLPHCVSVCNFCQIVHMSPACGRDLDFFLFSSPFLSSPLLSSPGAGNGKSDPTTAASPASTLHAQFLPGIIIAHRMQCTHKQGRVARNENMTDLPPGTYQTPDSVADDCLERAHATKARCNSRLCTWPFLPPAPQQAF